MNIQKPVRASRSYTQHLVAEPARVFPLLCPVLESDWIEGWDPTAVFSASGLAEKDCVFITPSRPHDAVWYITRHEPDVGFVEMIKITPRITACRLMVHVRAVPGGSEADVTYTHTSLGPEGNAFVASFTQEYYEMFMKDWEARMNHYLTYGSALQAVG